MMVKNRYAHKYGKRQEARSGEPMQGRGMPRRGVPSLRHRGEPTPKRAYTIRTEEVAVGPGIVFTRGRVTISDGRVAAPYSLGGDKPCMPPWQSVATGVWAQCCTQGCWDPPGAPDLSTPVEDLTNPGAPTVGPGGMPEKHSPPSSTRAYLASRMKDRKFRTLVAKQRRKNKC